MQMELAGLIGFAALAATLIAVPGADWAFIITAGARDRVVVPAVGGVLLGYALLTALVALGVGALVVTVPNLLTALTMCGSSYLIFLGVRSLLPTRAEDASSPRELPSAGHLVRGFGVSSLNPKGILIFLAILPQFARAQYDWPLPIQLAVLGVLFTVLCSFIYLPLGFTARKVAGVSPRLASIMPRVAGVSMIVVGSTLLIERVIELVG